MKSVLFVCHGNICRSPMAEFVLKALLREAGLAGAVTVDSAATSDEETGNPVYPPVRRLLAAHGIDCGGKQARRVTAEDYARYGLIVAMDRRNAENLRRLFGGDPEGKVRLLLEFAGRPGEEVADPWYTRDFEATWRDVGAGCAGLLDLCSGGRAG